MIAYESTEIQFLVFCSVEWHRQHFEWFLFKVQVVQAASEQQTVIGVPAHCRKQADRRATVHFVPDEELEPDGFGFSE